MARELLFHGLLVIKPSTNKPIIKCGAKAVT